MTRLGSLSIMLCLALAGGGIVAYAEGNPPTETYVDGKRVVLAVPEGECVYDPGQLFDAQILASLDRASHGNSQMVLAFADCKDLAAERMGKPSLTGYSGEIAAPFSLRALGEQYARSDMIRELNRQSDMGEESEEVLAQKLQAAQGRVVAAGAPQLLGILKNNQDYSVLATFQLQQVVGMLQPIPVLGVTITTKLGVPVVITLSRPGSSKEQLLALSRYSEAYMQTLIRLNGKEWSAETRRKIKIISGSAVVLVAAGIYLLRSRKGSRRL